MGWLEDLFGTEDSKKTDLAEKDLALDLLKDSKFILSAMAKAVTETVNPQLREILKKQFNGAVQHHFRLVDLSVQNNWYLPRLAPFEQVRQDYEAAQTLTE